MKLLGYSRGNTILEYVGKNVNIDVFLKINSK